MISSPSLPAALNVMGVDVTPFDSYSHALGCVADAIAAERQMFWVAINPQKIHRAWHSPELMELLAHADAGICDGIGVSVAAKILHGVTLPRCTGCDLFFELMPVAAEKGWSIFLLGASPASNQGAAEALAKRYPGLKIAGRCDGYFKDEQEVIRQINDSGADMLFVAMGTPRQEMWITRHMPALKPRFLMGVGGTFDVASGTNKRAPKAFRMTGTEFLYQLITQPWRWRRQLAYGPFMWRVLQTRAAGAPEPAKTDRT